MEGLSQPNSANHENAEELMFGAAESTGNLEKAAELFQVVSCFA
jgi:hypothetical protein